MGMTTGGQLVAKMLKKEGVRHIFTLCGLHVAPIYAACVEEGISVIDLRHEQAAAHAADAYARLTRGLGVAVVTAGPGVTDALTGVANAYAASSPLLLLGGAAPIFNQSRGSLQEMEQVDLFQRITKWSDRVPTPELVPLYLSKAARVALSGRPGPVFLELAWDDLRRFSELAQVPAFLNGAGRGCLPPDHPFFFQHARKEALSAADVVLVIGTPFDFRLNYGAEPTFSAQSKIIQVDIDPVEIGRNRAVEVGIISNAALALKAFAAAAPKVSRGSYVAGLRELEKKKALAIEEWIRSDSVPIHHYRLAREISRVANGAGQDPIFVADGGNWVALAAKVIELKRPGRWLDPGPLGCLGVGAPFAIAAKLLHPERPSWIIQGDGSFGLNGMDYETAVRFKLPMVCVIGNDAAWGQIRLPQVQMFGEDKSPATLLAPTRYDRIVEVFGGYGELVTEPAQIRPALERALAKGTVSCVNVMLDPDGPMKAGAMGYAV